MTATDSASPPVDRWALVSLTAAILTMAAVCGGLAPIPLTGFVCFPTAILLGLVAVATGLWSLHRIGSQRGRGRALALVGAGVGGVTIAATFCLVGLALWIYPSIAELFHRFVR